MPLPDAIDLLLRDFADYLEAEAASSAGSVAVLKASSPLPLPAPLSPTFQQHLQQSQQQQSHQQTHHHRRCCRHRHRHTSLSSLSTCTSISSSSLSFRSASSSATSSSNHLQKSRRKFHQSQQQKQLRLHHRHHHQQQQHSTREEADTSVTALGAETIPAPDDPNFLAPSRHVAVLLRMLADSRILSVGELDEISAFIAQRRARLTSELTAAESLVHRLSSSPHLCIDTSEALQMNETAFSSASEVIVTPNVGPKEPEFLHREAPPVSRYQAIFSDPSNRCRLRAHRGLRGKFRKNGSE